MSVAFSKKRPNFEDLTRKKTGLKSRQKASANRGRRLEHSWARCRTFCGPRAGSKAI